MQVGVTTHMLTPTACWRDIMCSSTCRLKSSTAFLTTTRSLTPPLRTSLSVACGQIVHLQGLKRKWDQCTKKCNAIMIIMFIILPHLWWWWISLEEFAFTFICWFFSLVHLKMVCLQHVHWLHICHYLQLPLILTLVSRLDCNCDMWYKFDYSWIVAF